jgi:hypothetical protein
MTGVAKSMARHPFRDQGFGCLTPACNTWTVDVEEDMGGKKMAKLTYTSPNGPIEGHINRLKFMKRSGYGRMQLDLLRQRVLYAAA